MIIQKKKQYARVFKENTSLFSIKPFDYYRLRRVQAVNHNFHRDLHYHQPNL